MSPPSFFFHESDTQNAETACFHFFAPHSLPLTKGAFYVNLIR